MTEPNLAGAASDRPEGEPRRDVPEPLAATGTSGSPDGVEGRVPATPSAQVSPTGPGAQTAPGAPTTPVAAASAASSASAAQRPVPPLPLPAGHPAPSYAPGQAAQPVSPYAKFAPPGEASPPSNPASSAHVLRPGTPPGYGTAEAGRSPHEEPPHTQPSHGRPPGAQHASGQAQQAQQVQQVQQVQQPEVIVAPGDRPAPEAAASQAWFAAGATAGGPVSDLGTSPVAAGTAWGGPAPAPRRGVGAGTVAGLLVAALFLGAVGGVVGPRLWDLVDGSPSAQPLPTISANPDITRPDGSIADIAAQVSPSVVSIHVAGADGQGTGSGFVIQEDGYILTNNHVIAGAVPDGSIRVTFVDGSETDATLVGRTSDYDIAVIKVDRTGLTPLALGDSDLVAVGDPVIAIGAPLGLDGTVTSGIISALNRPVTAGSTGDQAFIDALQTDAAINPGNSGGPLVNGSGEVIGINSAIAQPPGTTAAGNIGLGFAISSNQARRTAEEIIQTGFATYPVIGVLLDSGYDGEGVQVVANAQGGTQPVTPGGPAEKAGIKAGDVIVAIDGRPVAQSDQLIVAIRAMAPGDTVVLRVRSGSNERDVPVVLDKATSDEG